MQSSVKGYTFLAFGRAILFLTFLGRDQNKATIKLQIQGIKLKIVIFIPLTIISPEAYLLF